MEYLIGAGLAVVVCAFATLVGFDRDRVFYPTLVIVIATYYVLLRFVCRRWEFAAGASVGVPSSWRVSPAGRDRVQEEPLADRGCPRRSRCFRLLSSPVHLRSRYPAVVARLLPFLRRSRRWLPCRATDATPWICGKV